MKLLELIAVIWFGTDFINRNKQNRMDEDDVRFDIEKERTNVAQKMICDKLREI